MITIFKKFTISNNLIIRFVDLVVFILLVIKEGKIVIEMVDLF
jgi:hypothetical protein